MKFIETDFPEAFLIQADKIADDRGFFARVFCRDEFKKIGIDDKFVQANVGYNRSRYTFRGFHYQVPPYEEAKLVRCTAGGIYDIIVDMRPASPMYLRWQGYNLNAGEHLSLLIPKGFAHGYLTMADDTEVCYMVSQKYTPEAERGVRWNDPALRLELPHEPAILSEKDRSFPDIVI